MWPPRRPSDAPGASVRIGEPSARLSSAVGHVGRARCARSSSSRIALARARLRSASSAIASGRRIAFALSLPWSVAMSYPLTAVPCILSLASRVSRARAGVRACVGAVFGWFGLVG